MKIYLSKVQVIGLLNKRIVDLSANDYEPSAWKSKVQTDVDAIFGHGPKLIDIISLTLDTPYAGSKQQVRQEGKLKAKRMLEGFIESINDHIPDAVVVVSDDEHELFNNKVALTQKHEEIQKLKASQQGSNVLIEKIQNENQGLYNQLGNKDKEIEKLKSSIWQLEGVNISRLWMIFKSLPLPQQIAIIGFFIGLFSIGFIIGVFFQKNHWIG